MNADSVWELIANVSVGQVVAWVMVFFAIISGVIAVTIKLYKVFEKYHHIKAENEDQKAELKQHAETLGKIEKSLEEIKQDLAEQKDVNLRQIRYDIVHSCDEAIAQGWISAGKLKSTMGLFEDYTEIYHGNGYVKALVDKMLTLPVKGTLE